MTPDKARRKAFDILDSVTREGKYANLALKEELGGFSDTDRAFITALVYGTLEKQIFLDYVLSLYCQGRIQPKIRVLLRLSAYQILCMNVPDAAAVSSGVELCASVGKPMLKGFVNGVLRSVSREKDAIPYPKDPLENLSVRFSQPLFFVREMVKALGTEDAKAYFSYQSDHATTVRVDENKADPDKIREKLGGEKAVWFDNCFRIHGRTPSLEDGVCSVQSESSVAAVKLLAPEEGESILDACAAPGGKTVYLASLMKTGSITAADKYEHRVELIRRNALRCGYENLITPVRADYASETPQGPFDRVLLDAPCSGFGVAEEKPEIKNGAAPENMKALESEQARLLDAVAPLVREGGVLVYSTCSVRQSENEEQITRFLKKHPEFSLESGAGLFGERFEEAHDVTRGFLTLYPFRDHTEGFFMARMRKH